MTRSNGGYHHPVAVANYFIGKSGGLTLLQILKLSYIAHGFKLGLTGEPLVKELVQAWQYGPVFPCIYHEFKLTSSRLIEKQAKRFDSSQTTLVPVDSNFTEYEKELMDSVYKHYGSLEGWALSSLTHKKDTPWYEAWHRPGGGKDFMGVTIPNEKIQKHFEQIIEATS